jgi:quercetin dioxygenase-like cupin family protein
MMSEASLPPSNAESLDALIAVQPGAVASRTLRKSKTGTLTLFAFDEGQELSEHSAPFDAIVQVLEGRLLITIAGEPHVVQAGQIILMPADVPHALRAEAPSRMLLTMFREQT